MTAHQLGEGRLVPREGEAFQELAIVQLVSVPLADTSDEAGYRAKGGSGHGGAPGHGLFPLQCNRGAGTGNHGGIFFRKIKFRLRRRSEIDAAPGNTPGGRGFRRFGRTSPSPRDGKAALLIVEHLAAGAGDQGRQHAWGRPINEELHRPVAAQGVGAAGVEGVKLVDVATVNHAATTVLDGAVGAEAVYLDVGVVVRPGGVEGPSDLSGRVGCHRHRAGRTLGGGRRPHRS